MCIQVQHPICVGRDSSCDHDWKVECIVNSPPPRYWHWRTLRHRHWKLPPLYWDRKSDCLVWISQCPPPQPPSRGMECNYQFAFRANWYLCILEALFDWYRSACVLLFRNWVSLFGNWVSPLWVWDWVLPFWNLVSFKQRPLDPNPPISLFFFYTTCGLDRHR